jgi:hypothetical protein
MVEPISTGLAIASIASGIASNNARRSAERKQRRVQRGLVGLEREALEDRREQFEEDARRQARAFENQLHDRGIARSTIALEDRAAFLRELERQRAGLGREERRLDLGVVSGNIESELKRDLLRANQIQQAILGATALYDAGVFTPTPIPDSRAGYDMMNITNPINLSGLGMTNTLAHPALHPTSGVVGQGVQTGGSFTGFTQ